MAMTLFELLNLTAPPNRKNMLCKVFVLYKQYKFESPAHCFFVFCFFIFFCIAAISSGRSLHPGHHMNVIKLFEGEERQEVSGAQESRDWETISRVTAT